MEYRNCLSSSRLRFRSTVPSRPLMGKRCGKSRKEEIHVELNLPADVQIKNFLGEGRRCVVYAASYRGERVAVKAYRAGMMANCRRRYGMTWSAFEHRRNCEVYRIEAIRRFIARPVAL